MVVVVISHAIENPDIESEHKLLQSYAPSLPKETLLQLTKAFNELRKLVDEGHLSYPYSSREAINVAKHLQAFPNEPIERALENVFSFDAWADSNVKQAITEAFARTGFTLSKDFMQYPINDILTSARSYEYGKSNIRRKKQLQLQFDYDNDREVCLPSHFSHNASACSALPDVSIIWIYKGYLP